MEQLNNENLSEVSGGVNMGNINVTPQNITIRVSYGKFDGREKIRNALIAEMKNNNINTSKVPSAYSLWKDGMTAGCKAGTLVYECNEKGEKQRCYKG